jgi:hypothetical protein
MAEKKPSSLHQGKGLMLLSYNWVSNHRDKVQRMRCAVNARGTRCNDSIDADARYPPIAPPVIWRVVNEARKTLQ